MTEHPDIVFVSARAKLFMDRMTAYQIGKDPDMIARAVKWLEARKDEYVEPEWWVLDWLEILKKPVDEVRAFVRSKDEYARRMSLVSPFFRKEVTTLDFSDPAWRKRMLLQASRSLRLEAQRASERLHDDNDAHSTSPDQGSSVPNYR